MAPLEIRLLGEMALLRDGLALPLPRSKKTRALLGYLILCRRPERRERLCEMLWRVPDDPRGALRWSLSKLRTVVNADGVDRLQADRERVLFEPRDAHVDVLEWQSPCAGNLDGCSTAELAGLADALSAELLAGLELPDQPDFHYFLAAERRQLTSLRVTALRTLASRSEAPAEVAGWLQTLVALEPYDVELHRRLIEALALAGRRKEAERQRAVSAAVLTDLSEADRVALQRAAHRRPRVAGEAVAAPEPAALEQRIRFCKAADGVQIAYACVGDGPALVKTANWMNHLEYDWESPVWRHVFHGLASGRRLIRYDARGNGLSDWDTDDYSFESMVSDLEAVIDATGLERFPLLGLSQGCAVSVEYAVRHPEKVTRLILVGGYARGWHKLGSAEIDRQTEAMIVLVRIGWGKDNPAFRQMFTSMFMPDAPAENQLWFNELQRLTTSPENAVRLLRACGDVDVRHRLTQVTVPTLVIHARNDMRVPYSSGRELAAGIPGARFVSLPTRNHLLPESDPAWPRLLAEIEAFLAE